MGDEVVSVLKAADAAAERIRSRAEDVAAKVRRDIAELQGRLEQLSAQLDEPPGAEPSRDTPPSAWESGAEGETRRERYTGETS